MKYNSFLAEHLRVLDSTHSLSVEIEAISSLLCEAVKNNATIFSCGNGGSFSDSQHFTAELVGRFQADRRPLSAITLGANLSSVTAISNDYSFDSIFSRELSSIASSKDILIVLSTSGNSANILSALETAKTINMVTILLTGKSGGNASAFADYSINIDSQSTSFIQEAHITILHYFCSSIDDFLSQHES